jgi:hypothetical protein
MKNRQSIRNLVRGNALPSLIFSSLSRVLLFSGEQPINSGR